VARHGAGIGQGSGLIIIWIKNSVYGLIMIDTDNISGFPDKKAYAEFGGGTVFHPIAW
jgi:hypothetical protein